VRRARRALLVVTHDPNVRRIADRVVKIRDGKVSSQNPEVHA
jgi:ABC-type lipoprotein export system ATPase subunit